MQWKIQSKNSPKSSANSARLSKPTKRKSLQDLPPLSAGLRATAEYGTPLKPQSSARKENWLSRLSASIWRRGHGFLGIKFKWKF